MLASKPQELKITLASNPENILKIEPFLKQCQGNCNIREELYKDILLVLTEAVTNGIKHGNSSNPRKNVTVEFRSENQAIHFTVSDEGSGFNPQTLSDPTQGPNLSQPNGRGVFLMQALSDGVQFKDNGRCVDLAFRV